MQIEHLVAYGSKESDVSSKWQAVTNLNITISFRLNSVFRPDNLKKKARQK